MPQLPSLKSLMPAAPTPPQGPQPSIALLEGAVIAVAAEGYCVDSAASNPAQGFAIIATCATLGVSPKAPVANGIITVQVGAADTAIVAQDPAGFAAFVQTFDGERILSRAQDAETVEMDGVEQAEGYVRATFRDSADHPFGSMQDQTWRGFFDLKTRLVTVSVNGFDADPLDAGAGTALLNATVTAIIGANTPETGDDS